MPLAKGDFGLVYASDDEAEDEEDDEEEQDYDEDESQNYSQQTQTLLPANASETGYQKSIKLIV